MPPQRRWFDGAAKCFTLKIDCWHANNKKRASRDNKKRVVRIMRMAQSDQIKQTNNSCVTAFRAEVALTGCWTSANVFVGVVLYFRKQFV